MLNCIGYSLSCNRCQLLVLAKYDSAMRHALVYNLISDIFSQPCHLLSSSFSACMFLSVSVTTMCQHVVSYQCDNLTSVHCRFICHMFLSVWQHGWQCMFEETFYFLSPWLSFRIPPTLSPFTSVSWPWCLFLHLVLSMSFCCQCYLQIDTFNVLMLLWTNFIISRTFWRIFMNLVLCSTSLSAFDTSSAPLYVLKSTSWSRWLFSDGHCTFTFNSSVMLSIDIGDSFTHSFGLA